MTAQSPKRRVITFGTFDLFHIGHLNILKRARALGTELYVGLSSDELNMAKKGRNPIYDYEHRKQILESLRCVDQVFKEESLELKVDYVKQFQADVLTMGADWEGKFDFCKPYCEVIYLPRTPSISTTELIEIIREI
ncbi:adenylyltransferase/cytidyltransferase family protein [Permianibacter sp. IMCC34836]|uniref:adenylyltransferase/cytidyltransferase family protein n=1 Tax=Permianibacter fluminis TaxID=2738515 RepID=UPI001557FD26|nr:adenylyltransferase/cytidyltransferase family protein [Permianibacter fluminis]NQD35438.1 adenylyltransferase/cytidyltransferase family protein [Permianibacter fluminis]